MTTNPFASPATSPEVVDFRRDGYGRPIVGQTTGKPIAYTRSSTAAKAIEDTYNLNQWAQRNVAYGVAHDVSLAARVLAVGGAPATWGKAEKDAVAEVVEAAHTAAKAHANADIGTALHKMTEDDDHGINITPGRFLPDVEAYREAKAALGIITHREWIECRMVSDILRMAGTADRIVTVAPNSPLRKWMHPDDEALISDLKTGRSVDFGGLSMSSQLAAYASGHLYDPAEDVRLPTPRISKVSGLIIHLPAGEGRCTVYRADLVKGLAAAHLANAIRRTRTESKKWLTPVTPTKETPAR